MKKRLYTIWSILLVLVVSIAVLVPGCTGGEECTIEVKATLCGEDWPGELTYRLTCDGEDEIYGHEVPGSHTVAPGNWTCTYISGGPEWSEGLSILNGYSPTYYVIIDPPWGMVTGSVLFPFEILFGIVPDIGIEFLHWTVDGVPWQSSSLNVSPCQVVDVHFHQWVEGGCIGSKVAANETSWLEITQTGGPSAMIYVPVGSWCAVNKVLTGFTGGAAPPLPLDKVSQVRSFNGAPVGVDQSIPLTLNETEYLDVETAWELVMGANYTKSINWLGISEAPLEEGDEHDCVLFELVLPGPGTYTFTLVASAELELVGITELYPNNNSTGWSPSLNLTVNVP